jgi:DUF4097 and DUF4098 domain-containing protein YvlB
MPASAQQTIERGHSATADPYVRIYVGSSGTVSVSGWDRDSVDVSGTADEAAGPFDIGGGADAMKMGLWAEDNPDAIADLRIRVPAGATVWLKVVGASVDVSGVTGGLDVYSVTGDVRVEGSPREVYAETMAGKVDILGSSSSVRAKTANGSITFRGESDDVSLNTVSGKLTVAVPLLKRGRFETVTGDVYFEGDLDRGSSTTFQTHSGGVELRLPRDAGADVSVTTVEGTLQNDFGPQRSRDDMSGREIQLEIGAGGAAVTIHTFSGAISIRKG